MGLWKTPNWEIAVILCNINHAFSLKKLLFSSVSQIHKKSKHAKFQLYGTSYSQSPQVFPQLYTRLFLSNFENFCQIRQKRNFSARIFTQQYGSIPKNLHKKEKTLLRKSKMQESKKIPAFSSKCLSQDGFGGVSVQLHACRVAGKELIIGLGADHGAVVSA